MDVLKIVSTDKILCFINTLTIIIMCRKCVRLVLTLSHIHLEVISRDIKKFLGHFNCHFGKQTLSEVTEYLNI